MLGNKTDIQLTEEIKEAIQRRKTSEEIQEASEIT